MSALEIEQAGMFAWLLSIVLTACLSLAVLAIIQLRVVPRVESRKRREDRWERDVLALGELLTTELADCCSGYAAALYRYIAIEQLAQVSPERMYDLRSENATVRRELRDEHRRLIARADWLVDRVQSIDERGLETRRFYVYALGLTIDSVSNLDPTFDAEDALSLELLDAVAQKEREARREVIEQLKCFARGPVPHPRSRLSKLWARLRRRLRRRASTWSAN